MKTFEYVNPGTLDQAVEALRDKDRNRAAVIAGGIDLLGELKERTFSPERVVNLKKIPGLAAIEDAGGGLKIGALVTLTDLAESKAVVDKFPALRDAALSVATPQIRNFGTVGGNLCQRPRCWYYRSADFHCLKKGGSRCFSVDGENRYHAIFGPGPCHIVHPSDLAPMLIALGAKALVTSPEGDREIALEAFFRMPHQNMFTETALEADEVVTHVVLPAPAAGHKSAWVKFREKKSLDFAVSAVALAGVFEGGVVREPRIVLGGVAPIPWRVKKAEEALAGKKIDDATAKAVADTALEGAQPMRDNAYKIALTKTLVRRGLASLA